MCRLEKLCDDLKNDYDLEATIEDGWGCSSIRIPCKLDNQYYSDIRIYCPFGIISTYFYVYVNGKLISKHGVYDLDYTHVIASILQFYNCSLLGVNIKG